MNRSDSIMFRNVRPLLMFGVICLAAAIFIPAQTWLVWLRPEDSGAFSSELVIGSSLFRLGWMLLALWAGACAWVFRAGRQFQSSSTPSSSDQLRQRATFSGAQGTAPDTPLRQSRLRGGRSASRRDAIVSVLWLLCLVLPAAGLLRLYRLDAGLWHDEILTLVRYARMPFGEIISTYYDQNQHFLYTILAHASMELFGESAWSFRLPAVLFGVAGVWALFYFAIQVTSRKEALLSACFLAVSYHHVWFSQNARGYSGLLFWTLLASGLFLRGLKSDSRPLHWLLYGTSVALGIYTHLTMVLVVGAHFFYFMLHVIRDRKTRGLFQRAMLLGFGLSAVLTFQLHSLVLPQLLQGMGEVSTVPAWTRPLWAVIEFARAARIGLSGSLAAAVGLAVFGAGCWSYFRSTPVLLYLLVAPSAVGGALVVAMGHHLWPRFFFFAFGFAIVVVIRGCMVVGEAAAGKLAVLRRSPIPAGSAICLLLILFSSISLSRAYAPKQDFQGALAFVESNRLPGDRVATVGLARFTYQHFYNTGWENIDSLQDLQRMRSTSPRMWLVYTFPPEVRSVYPEVMQAIEKEFELVRQFPGTVGAGAIFVCRSVGPQREVSESTFLP